MEVKEFVSGGKKTEDSKKNMKKKINSAKKNYAKKNSQFTIAELKENSALIMLCVFVVFAVSGNCSGYTGMEDAGSERMYCSVD